MAKLNINSEYLSSPKNGKVINERQISKEKKEFFQKLHQETNSQITKSNRQYADAYYKASSYLSF